MSDAPFVARVSRTSVAFQVFLLGLAAVMFALLARMLTRDMPVNLTGVVARVVGAALALGFVYLAFQVGRAFFHRDPALIVDAEGIHMPGCLDQPLRWHAITRIEPGHKRLNLWLAEGAPIPSDRAARRMIGNNRVTGKPDLPLSMLLTDRTLDELVEAVRSRAPQLFA